MRIACLYILFCVGAFVVCAATAMLLFFGSNDYNPVPGPYAFWLNTCSELGEPSKYAPNQRGVAWVYNGGLMLASSTLVPLFWMLPVLLAGRGLLRRAVRWLGMASVAGAVGVGLTPADTMGFWHTVTIGCVAVPGLAATASACLGIATNPARSRPYRVMTAVALVLAATHFGQYVWHFWLGFAWTWVSTSTQKLMMISALTWIAWSAVLIWRESLNPERQ